MKYAHPPEPGDRQVRRTSRDTLPAGTADEPIGHTRIRLVDDDGETIGIIWTAGDADDDYIRSLIPDGVKAMVARNIWPG